MEKSVVLRIEGNRKRKMKKTTSVGILLAVLAAALYAVNSPFSKLLLNYMPPTLMAGFLYIGAGLGIGIVALFRKLNKKLVRDCKVEEKITKADIPYCNDREFQKVIFVSLYFLLYQSF